MLWRVVSLAASAAAVVGLQLHAGIQVNENTFEATIQNGLSFLECYSPFCPHCKRFAPTWIGLVGKMKEFESQGLKMGQVDCIAQGDLCIRLNVDFYPQMKLYEDGKFIESYNGEKEVPDIAKYLEKKLDEYQAKHPKPIIEATKAEDEQVPKATEKAEQDQSISQTTTTTTTTKKEDPVQASPIPSNDTAIDTLIPIGHMISLDHTNWNQFTTATYPVPIFIQFQTGWCKECRTLSPMWEDLARQLKDQSNIASIDCEIKLNQEICKSESIKTYPSFILYHNGIKVSYTGPKTVTSMVEFVQKALVTPGSHQITGNEFDSSLQKSPLIFLFLHSSNTPLSIYNVVQSVGKGFLGSTTILETQHSEIFQRFSLSTNQAYLLVFKEHQIKPWSKLILTEESKNSSRESERDLELVVQHWITFHSIPIMDQLNHNNYLRIFNSGSTQKLVVLVCLSGIHGQSKDGHASLDVVNQFKVWAIQWRQSQEARSVEVPIDWVWVDTEEWADWLHKTYGIDLVTSFADEEAEHSKSIIIVNPTTHTYYDHQENNVPIQFKPSSIFQTLLAIETGQIHGRLTGTISSRFVWRFHQVIRSVKMTIGPHYILLWIPITCILLYTMRTVYRRNVGGGGGYSSIGSHPAPSDLNSNTLKPTAFATVFGLNSNVALKAD
ncbi:hypothetical protein MJO29_014984 [Puccinia striiformis f. sp. tritici]|nr:hypothetical protein MJO29_014984 [Puccinia striiformis f. sp. tritici]KAI9607825.1 hypothetical protein H4Q26_005271 [Puccinia striiformis f. sp. tritici PST-130]